MHKKHNHSCLSILSSYLSIPPQENAQHKNRTEPSETVWNGNDYANVRVESLSETIHTQHTKQLSNVTLLPAKPKKETAEAQKSDYSELLNLWRCAAENDNNFPICFSSVELKICGRRYAKYSPLKTDILGNIATLLHSFVHIGHFTVPLATTIYYTCKNHS